MAVSRQKETPMWPFAKTKRPCNSTAVLLIDMQEKFMPGLSKGSQEMIVPAQVRVLRECAAENIPLIVIEYKYDGPTLALLEEEIKHIPTVHRIVKQADDAFSEPVLLTTLSRLGVERLLLMGVNASMCVQQTAASALKEGFEIVTARNLIADPASSAFGELMRDFADFYGKHGTLFTEVPPLKNLVLVR